MTKTRLLLADDHVLVRAGIRSLLEKMPSIEVVAEANNGREALELVRTSSPNLVLMTIPARRSRSPRQREIVQLVAEGKSTKGIPFLLGLSGKTVEAHRAHVMARLDIHDVPALVRYAMRMGLTPLSSTHPRTLAAAKVSPGH